MRRGGLEASEACRNRALRERDISRAQATDAELKSRDAAIFFSGMDASVSSEKELRLAAEAVRVKTEEKRLQQAELALRAERQHRAWTERWPCHADGAVYILCRCIHNVVRSMLLSVVPVMYTALTAGIKYQEFFRGTCMRARARVPSPSPPRTSIGPEPEPSIRRWTIRCPSPNFPANPSTHP